MYRPTQRKYRNIENNEVFTMFQHDQTKDLKLMNETNGKECKKFVLAAFTPIDFKFKSGKVQRLNVGEFMEVKNDLPTHKKFFIEKRFRKL